tara:strand:+ start:622 stop:1137 length:516 start_codon:yes stop_codon:yes gene_type:complete
MKRKYNPTSARSIAGKSFQDSVLNELANSGIFTNVEDFREKKRHEGIESGKPYTELELSIFEKTWGDITFEVNGERHYVECCFAMGDFTTSMCEIKRNRFLGDNKWYCYGKRTDPSARVFIPSRVWHDYMGRLELSNKNGWGHRTVQIKYIGENIRAAMIGQKNFENMFRK